MQEKLPGYTACLGEYQERIDRSLNTLDRQRFVSRLWDRDASLWRQGSEGKAVILNRLGWLETAEAMRSRLSELAEFTKEVRNDGFSHAVLMGMGGSSLSPEVSAQVFGSKQDHPKLYVLDSTVPATIQEIERLIQADKTLFIVSTKSGTTVETLSAYRYFLDKVAQVKGQCAGKQFVGITDPGTPLEREASKIGFRKLFANAPDIGGRYSALSCFGLVPASLIGVDVSLLIDRAVMMADACRAEAPTNPGVVLGATIAELAIAGRDKMTMLLSPKIASFGSWVEQLMAESTGKSGRGILPVDCEPIGDSSVYMDDRFFVYVRLEGSTTDSDELVVGLESSGHPVITIGLRDVYDIGGEYFRWEMATAVASALLGVNAFDEPNVKESKDITGRLLQEYGNTNGIPDGTPLAEESGLKLFCDAEIRAMLDQIRTRTGLSLPSFPAYLTAYLQECRPGNYIALLAFVHKSPGVDGLFQRLRACLRNKLGVPTTLGYGPRFLHSTGQLHKGGPNNGMFIQFTADDEGDVPIPGAAYGFSALKQAQAAGDAIALQSKGRPFIRIHLGNKPEAGLSSLLNMLT